MAESGDTTIITTIDLIRHGQCTDGHYYRGSTDVAMSSLGFEAMNQRINALLEHKPAPWQQLVSSPLIRCRAFAEDLASRYACPLTFDQRLQEMHFGDWDGQSIEHIWQTQQAKVEQWFADPVRFPPPNGEAADQFSERVSQALLSIAEQYAGQHLLLVTHGGVVRILLAHCLSMSLQNLHRFDVPYACLSRIQLIQADGQYHYRLIAHNIANNSLV